MKKNRRIFSFLIALSCLMLSFVACTPEKTVAVIDESATPLAASVAPFSIQNGNQPNFSDVDKARTDAFEVYSPLDSLGRCGVAYANICRELQPTQERGEIGMVKPSGWQTVKYNDIIDGNYLYNRCHLIGYQLAGENANVQNLITGTRYLNMEGMLPFENKVAAYVEATNNHVLYRVTPVFQGTNLVASAVLMEAWSVEDHGAGICFNVCCNNIQPGIVIDYATGNSCVDPNFTGQTTKQAVQQNVSNNPPAENTSSGKVWLSESGKKYHSVNNCGNMNPAKARQVTEAEALASGHEKCKKCW